MGLQATAIDLVSRVHVLLFAATGGRIGGRYFGGVTFCLVEHTGRRTGRRRTTPLLFVRDGSSVVVVASNGGAPRHPAWWLNLQATPEATVRIGSRRWPVRAREASERERERLWPRLTRAWPAFDSYQARTARRIPVVILEPRDD